MYIGSYSPFSFYCITYANTLVETDYQMTYYVSDGFLAVCCIIIIVFLNVKAETHKQNAFHAFKRIANPASGAFVIIMIVSGIGIGVMSSYGIVYLQEEMEASSSMIGK